MYRYRKLSKREQKQLVHNRKIREFPLHEPPRSLGKGTFLITAATYNHQNFFAREPVLEGFVEKAFVLFGKLEFQPQALVFLPNHYHLLIPIDDMFEFSECIRKLHCLTSAYINRLDNEIGRRVWYSFSDRRIRNDWHLEATIHYIHFNPVKHGWAKTPELWKWSSIHQHLKKLGNEELYRNASRFDLSSYGKGWDEI
jgi:putative transposase